MTNDRYRRVARLMLHDGQIWFLYDSAWAGFRAGDKIPDRTWELLDEGSLMASQHRQDPGPPGEPGSVVVVDGFERPTRPQITRFNRDFVLWVRADQE